MTRTDPLGAAPSAIPTRTAVPFVLRLCGALADAGVRYCHWKSTSSIDRSAMGENDLDLLVAPRDARRFDQILLGLGCVPAHPPGARSFPGIKDYYGFDASSGRLIHVHAHYRLVIGHDASKNYRLPIEGAFLAETLLGPLFPLPPPALEFTVLVLRLVLKHCTWDSIAFGQGSMPTSARREFEDMKDHAEPSAIRAVLREMLPFIDDDLFLRCVSSLRPRAPIRVRVGTAADLERALAPYGRRSPAADAMVRMRGRIDWQLRGVVRPRSTRRRLDSGGAVVAVVGGDGAGKTTSVRALEAWLSAELMTSVVHLGKPTPSAMTLATRAALALARAISAFSPPPDPVGGTATLPHGWFASLWQLRQVSIARDRYRAHVRARRVAAAGGIALCDRYPTTRIKLMDGPRLGSEPGRPPALLARAERGYYQRMLPPDVLIVLRASPETATARRSPEDAVVIRARSHEIWAADWDGTPAVVVDADRPLADVVAELKSIVWSGL